MSARTGWFPPTVKPARAGVYYTRVAHLARRPDLSGYAYWNGEQWSPVAGTVARAYAARKWQATYQCKAWQGLTR